MADETFYAVDLPPMIVPGRMILAFWIESHNFPFCLTSPSVSKGLVFWTLGCKILSS